MGVYMGNTPLTIYNGGQPAGENVITEVERQEDLLAEMGEAIESVALFGEEELYIIPGTETIEYIPEENYMYSKVTVEGDEDLIPENIKEGVKIFGITGTASGGEITNAKIKSYLSYQDTIEPNTFFQFVGKIDEESGASVITTQNNLNSGCSYSNYYDSKDVFLHLKDNIYLLTYHKFVLLGFLSCILFPQQNSPIY